MCGLYGGIGIGVNPGVIRSLAILNEGRGRDGTGFFNSTGALHKNAVTSTTELKSPKASTFIESSAKKTWAVCGHTRGGTRGGAITSNAHPFQYGRVVGSHNGVLDAPNKYPVDTMYAIDLLSQAEPGDYQKALGGVEGWYVLTWLDLRNKCIYLLHWEGTLHFMKHDGVWYYSSQGDHLATAVGTEKGIASIDKKAVICFSYVKDKGVVVRRLPDFTGKERVYRQANTVMGFPQHNRHYHDYDDGVDYVTRDSDARDWRTTTPTARDRSDLRAPAGFVVKFPTSGLWHALMLDGYYRLIRTQAELNEEFKHEAPGTHLWMQPGRIRSILTEVSHLTPSVPPPPGLKGVPKVEGQKIICIPQKPEAAKVVDPDADTKILGCVEQCTDESKKKDFDEVYGEGSRKVFPDEDEQEKQDLERAKSQMDVEGAALDRVNAASAQRWDFLINIAELTPEEAKQVMEDEQYIPLTINT